MMSLKKLWIIPALCLMAVGCTGGDVQVTKDQEEAFRNPPKEIPPEAAAAMAKAREDGARRAAEAMQKSKQGGQ